MLFRSCGQKAETLPTAPTISPGKTFDAIGVNETIMWKVLDLFDRPSCPKSRSPTDKKHGSDKNLWREALFFKK